MSYGQWHAPSQRFRTWILLELYYCREKGDHAYSGNDCQLLYKAREINLTELIPCCVRRVTAPMGVYYGLSIVPVNTWLVLVLIFIVTMEFRNFRPIAYLRQLGFEKKLWSDTLPVQVPGPQRPPSFLSLSVPPSILGCCCLMKGQGQVW